MPKKQKPAKAQSVEQDIAVLTEDLKRVQADFINYKRRAEEDQARIMELAKTEVIKQVLPILDNIERAIAQVPKNLENDAWAQGVAQVAKQAQETLNALGVKKINANGQEFNPELHEAVAVEEADPAAAGEREVVAEEMQAGYKIGDEVIRPSMVKVRKEK